MTVCLKLVLLAALVPGFVLGQDLISVGANGRALGGGSFDPAISSDGQTVVFASQAKLAPASDQNALLDVYVRDRVAGTTRRVSDDRGGDRPAISANGRYVVYRGSFDAFPQLRELDLFSDQPLRTISYPITGFTFRSAGAGSLTPDGRFIQFAYGPIPGLQTGDQSLYVIDRSVADRTDPAAADSIADSFQLETLGRVAMTRNGNTFFAETSDRLSPTNDTNEVQDIYRIVRNSNSVVRLSAVTDGELLVNGGESPAAKLQAAHHPAMSSDGDIVYFISERQLRSSDTDGRASIYRSDVGSNFQIPAFIPTPGVTPLAMSLQATGDGKYLVFVGKPTRGGLRSYILQLSDGALRTIASSTASLPVISADNGTIAYVTTTGRGRVDGNKASDVYVVANPFPDSKLTSPTVTLTSNPAPIGGGDTIEITSGTNVTLSAAASGANVGFVFTRIELDGATLANVTAGSVPPASYAMSVGIHKVRAATMDRANLAGRSTELTVIVRPTANQLAIRGVEGLVKATAPDRHVEFSGSFLIDNTFATTKGPLRVLLTESANRAKWEFFGDNSATGVPEQTLDIITIPTAVSTAVGAGFSSTPAVAPFASATRAPEVVSPEGFTGIGYTVLAQLQEQVGGAWQNRGSKFTLLSTRPRLSDQTPGPNGGIPVLGANETDPNFNPTSVTAVTVSGVTSMQGVTIRQFTAAAVFQGANPPVRPVQPVWSVSPATGVSISAAGVLTVGKVARTRTVTVRADFQGQTGTLAVTLKPRLPAVSVKAPLATVLENGTGASFRILRSPSSSQPLTVSYRLGGEAGDPLRGADDFTGLTGSATIAAGQSFVDIPIGLVNDMLVEGDERIVMTLIAGGEYRLGTINKATVAIDDDDDEPFPPGTNPIPDVTIRLGTGREEGAKIYSFHDRSTEQIVAARARTKPLNFTIKITNPNPANAGIVVFRAGGDFNGFTVKYFQGNNDVTAAVLDGTLDLNGNANSFAPGEAAFLRVQISAAKATIGSVYPCHISMGTNIGATDLVQALVTRVK